MIQVMGWIGIAVGILTAAPQAFKLTAGWIRSQPASPAARHQLWSRLDASLLLISASLLLLIRATWSDWAAWTVRSAVLVLVAANLAVWVVWRMRDTPTRQGPRQ